VILLTTEFPAFIIHYNMKKVIVLGGGLAGLSSAWKLQEAGYQVTVIEKSDAVGGLAKTIHRGSFSCDLGPHRFITHNKELLSEIRSLMGNKLLLPRYRKSKIRIQDKYIEYPPSIKNAFLNFNILTSIKILTDYLATYIRNKIKPRPDDSFENWVVNRFGRTLYNIYFRDYTAKLWHIPPSIISPDWAAQRISIGNLSDVLKHFFLKNNKIPRTYASIFYYPTGGIGVIPERMAQCIKEKGGEILTGHEVTGLEAKTNRIFSVRYKDKIGKIIAQKPDFVVSTIPVGKLVEMISEDAVIKNASSHLKSMSLIYLFLLIGKDSVSDNHWFYFPEKKYTFNRISEVKNFCDKMMPPGKTLLCIEITCKKGDDMWKMEAKELYKKIEKEISEIDLINTEDIEDIFLHREESAYPIYDIDYRNNLALVLDYINNIENMITIGRQGLFRYNNMDHSIEMGYKLAEFIKGTLEKEEIFKVGTKSEYFG